ncbi:MAG: transglycosylase SLT domain-containing protein [Desulfovibrio sp.]|jgi:membrane-bound lytic murein transglycosylase C|nr:transglycosylase SLT domain-containing protein [Desulfovibrio sp.]
MQEHKEVNGKSPGIRAHGGSRQGIDENTTARGARVQRSGFGRFPQARLLWGLCLCAALAAFCAGMLAARAGMGQAGVSRTGGMASAFSSRVVLPADPELLDAAALPEGADTLLPHSALLIPRFAARADAGARGGLSDAGPENMRDVTAVLPSPGKHQVLNFTRGQVLFATQDGGTAEITPLGLSPAGALPGLTEAPGLFRINLFAPARSYGNATLIPMLSGGVRDASGLLRTAGAADDPERRLCPANSRNANLMRLLLRGRGLPDFESPSSASRYRGTVGRYAGQYGLNPALIMAVMHTESNFNPSAVSRSRAMGLMQLVPDTAGYEVHRYLTGSPAVPDRDILLSPEHNIRYGAAYLYLLGSRYFNGVHNNLSRQLCVIAAYNGGPNAVLRLFDPEDDENAVRRINALGPEQLYDQLTTRMPTSESRRYVGLVLARLRGWSANGEY